MRGYEVTEFGGPEVLRMSDMPEPATGPEEVLVRVRAAGVNRADILQRQGTYPMLPGDNMIQGLEVAGDVVARGARASAVDEGERVFGLVRGGGYAEYVALDHRMAVPIPEDWSYVEAAAVIEVFCTAQEAVFGLGELTAGQTILVHAGGSGVGSAAIQMAKQAGATVIFTTGSDEKIARAKALGGDVGINYKTQNFLEETRRATGDDGVDVIGDLIGAPYLMDNLQALKSGGRLVMVGNLGGREAQLELWIMFARRLKILGFTLRNQSVAEKRAITERFRERWLPLLAAGEMSSVIHKTLPFAEAAEAHRLIERNENFGKVILVMD